MNLQIFIHDFRSEIVSFTIPIIINKFGIEIVLVIFLTA